MEKGRIVLCGIGAFFVLVFCVPTILSAQIVEGENIRSFDVTLAVQKDSSVRITEAITYDFGSNERHGIFRFVPISYSAKLGYKKKIRIADVAVVDENGQAYKFTTSLSGSNVQFKIGEPDILIRGIHTYIISYTLHQAIGYFDAFDELYWNATGNEWNVPIRSAQVKLSLPQDFSDNSLRIACYEGLYGDTTECGSSVSHIEGRTVVLFEPNRGYGPREGMTVAVGFPKGLVVEPTMRERIVQFAQENGSIFLPILTLFFMTYLWWKKGRDPKGRGVIIPQYDVPDGLTPLEVAAVYRAKVQNKDISAEIIFLAIRGYIAIKYIEDKKFLYTKKDYELELLRVASDLPSMDQLILQHLFLEATTVKISKLKDEFVKHVRDIQNDIFKRMVSSGLYKTSPKASLTYRMLGMIFVFLGIFLANQGIVFAASLVATGIVILIFGGAMPAKTEKGMEIYEYILGLREYLQIAEKDRLNFHNAPEKKPEVFEKLLPYAMVLGVEKAWAKEFADIYMQEPSWYHGTGGTFNGVIFMTAMGNFRTYSARTLKASSHGSGSGGGGFSGGGGGGGGGGSW